MSASVFPARAGMSRPSTPPAGARRSVPRASGDEPGTGAVAIVRVGVFPARAGMSRVSAKPILRPVRVPRASGDEPSLRLSSSPRKPCSPRERG